MSFTLLYIYHSKLNWQLVKTPKPTGDGVCPPEVTHAHHIDDLINERAGTRYLNNSDFDDPDADGKTHNWSDKEDDLKPECHTVVARFLRTEAPPTRHNARGVAAADLMTRLSTAFDPAVQRARDEEHTNRSLANTQYLTLAQQLCDSQATTESLRSQLIDVCNQLYEAQHEYDHAEMRLEMMQSKSRQPHREAGRYHNLPKHKLQSYRWFADGGKALAWLDSDDDEGVPGHAEDQSGKILDILCCCFCLMRSCRAGQYLDETF